MHVPLLPLRTQKTLDDMRPSEERELLELALRWGRHGLMEKWVGGTTVPECGRCGKLKAHLIHEGNPTEYPW